MTDPKTPRKISRLALQAETWLINHEMAVKSAKDDLLFKLGKMEKRRQAFLRFMDADVRAKLIADKVLVVDDAGGLK